MTAENSSQASEPAKDLRIVALIAYGLFLAAAMNGFTAVVGLVLAYVKRGDARGTIYESHFENLITVFWVSLVIAVLLACALLFGVFGLAMSLSKGYPGLALFWLPAAYFGWIVLAVWYLYRTVKGLVRAIDGKPYA
ncbi:MAG: hypothetical protein HY243_08635 [Proteobacteria bacterium]|nr:hypothetical protein [Pseudomonadota bacterium]